MVSTSFLKSGHKPTLFSSFIYSDMSFMVWVLLGPLVIYIGQDLGLLAGQQYTLVAIPLLAGALLRIPVGILVDRFDPLRVGILSQLTIIIVLFTAYSGNLQSVWALYGLAATLGIAGTSMAVAIPLTSRWYPDKHQGLALGIAGAASSGTVLAALFAPSLAELYGWQTVFGLAIIPVFISLFLFLLLAKNSPKQPETRAIVSYAKSLLDVDAWWFMLFYAMAFGGVIALASILVLFFHEQYQLTPVDAGYFTAACVLAGSILRPFGGWLADNWGGIRSMQILYSVVAVSLFLVGLTPSSSLVTMMLLVITMAALGMASGAVFQLVPLRFRHQVGATTGMVGAAGGLGGFILASLLGQSKVLSGEFQLGFFIFAGFAVLCLLGIRQVKMRWRTTWGAGDMTSARV
ncbi:Nitrate/nitrite transporter [hydrothermal vent metagenome]|uniref:Nitrate/nitrite transporter n=1 Tax=hydrothermal vent metagenome TaxID=652676 RepID=A0A3B1AKE9_9ZZZZ